MSGIELKLRLIEKKDLPMIVDWRNQKEIRRFFFTSSLLSKSGQEMWFSNYAKDELRRVFIAESEQDPVGMIGLSHIDYQNRSAEIGSTIVGNSSLWGKGLGTKMICLLLRHAFEELRLNRVYAYAMATNKGSINAKKKCGFKLEGILRESFYNGVSFCDTVLLGLSKTSWEIFDEARVEKC